MRKATVQPAGNNTLLQAGRTRLWTSWQGTLFDTRLCPHTFAFQSPTFSRTPPCICSAGRQGASLDTLEKTLFQTHTHHNDTHHILQGTVSNLCPTSEMISAAKTALYLETQRNPDLYVFTQHTRSQINSEPENIGS